MLTKSTAATKEDAGVYREIAKLNGGRLTTQILPSMEKLDVLALLDKANL